MRAAPARHPVTVLVVADEDAPRALLSDALRRDGYHVLAAETARDAASYLEAPNGRIDLVLSDIRRPGPTALDLARLIRTTRERTPLIVVNGGAELAGDATTLPKPFRLDVLRRAVLTTIVANVKRSAAEREPALKIASRAVRKAVTCRQSGQLCPWTERSGVRRVQRFETVSE
jgi:DNA-binding NtrC family response regulator